MTIAIRSSTFAALLLIFAASASAQDPPAPTPPQVTCADWGSFSFFELASPDTVFACIAARGLHLAARSNADALLALLALGADDTAVDEEGLTPVGLREGQRGAARVARGAADAGGRG